MCGGVWVSDFGVDVVGILGGGRCTTLRRWAGEQAISSVVEIRTIFGGCVGVWFGGCSNGWRVFCGR
jgi:hypothetical protein